MKDFFRTHPMIALLALMVVALLLCARTGTPNLLFQTECPTIDSLRTYAFVLRGEPHETRKCWRYDTQQRVLLYVLRDSARTMPHAGDTIIAKTRIRRGGQIGDFDYGLYLRRQGVIGTAYAGKYLLKPAVNSPKPSLQKRLYQRLQAAGLQGDELATTGALTLGYKEDLDPQLRHHFQAAGAAHVLAVSGLHTGIIYGLLVALLTLGGRVRPRYENRLGRALLHGTLILAIWAYAWLTGMTPSVVRCAVMISIAEIGVICYRQALSLNTIAAAAVLILLVRPLDLWNVSFQLSFAATAAIIILTPTLPYKEGIKNKALLYVAGLIVVSLAAQIGTLPITMYTFGQVSNYFLLTNLMVLPLATLLVPCGLVSIALGGSWLGQMVGMATDGLAWLMNHAVGWIESLPGSTTLVHINGWMVGLLYAAIIMGWLSIQKSLWWLIGVAATIGSFCVLFALGL